jgi:hypothetical protein
MIAKRITRCAASAYIALNAGDDVYGDGLASQRGQASVKPVLLGAAVCQNVYVDHPYNLPYPGE